MSPKRETFHDRHRGMSYQEDEETYNEDDDNFNSQYHKRYYDNEARCCSGPKVVLFLVTLGITFGVVFGLVDLDTINNAIGSGTNNNNESSSEDSYTFMQCPKNGECCNGLESNCDLRVNEIMWATVHNANHDDVFIPNNEAPLEQALEAGYRGLFLDVCLCNDETGNLNLQFCHTMCNIGKRDPIEVFTNIRTFLTSNPSEVIFINFEISSGKPSPALIWNTVVKAGLKEMSYIHTKNNFPTMRSLVKNGRQLILSKHNGKDCTDPTIKGCKRRIVEYFNYVAETDYAFNNVEAIEDSMNSCLVTRGLEGTKQFYAINNFVTSSILGPSKSSADIVNEQSFLEKRIKDCQSVTGMEANIIAVDFWQRGDLPKVVQETNIARAIKRRSLLQRAIQRARRWLRSW